MTSKKLADFVALLHTAWVALGIVSLPLLFMVKWWYLIALVYSAINFTVWTFWGCPLVALEINLRKKDNLSESLEGRGFMEYYLKKYFNITITKSLIVFTQRVYVAVLIVISLIQIFRYKIF